MAYQAGQGKTAVALFVDGLELKFVQLALKGGTVQLRDFKSVALVQKFEEKTAASAAPEEAGGFGDLASDTFAAPTPTEAGEKKPTRMLRSSLGFSVTSRRQNTTSRLH